MRQASCSPQRSNAIGNGQVSSLETYAAGKLVKAEYFDEAGKQLTDTSMVNRTSTIKGGQSAWKKYLEPAE